MLLKSRQSKGALFMSELELDKVLIVFWDTV